ncbi:hypothetical protein QPK87_05790 [Kamptonema cortianum]|nr:hypothetical protein [Kamptonema cortianum]
MVLQTDLPTDPFAYMAQADVGTMASGAAAVVLNVFFPGLGQIVLGKVGKGIAFLVVAAICWAGVLLMPGGLPGVISFMTSGKSVPGFSSLSMLFLGVGVLNWLFAIIDTSASAKRMKPMKVERPVIPDISEFIKKDSDPR